MAEAPYYAQEQEGAPLRKRCALVSMPAPRRRIRNGRHLCLERVRCQRPATVQSRVSRMHVAGGDRGCRPLQTLRVGVPNVRSQGLIKYALQHGYSCVPIYSFGEDETYYTFTPLLSFRLWLNKFNLPGVVFFGESWLPLLPKCSAEVLTYVGPPLQLPLIEQPTKEQVDEWHGKYIAALTTLFDTHKKEAGHEHAHLEIW